MKRFEEDYLMLFSNPLKIGAYIIGVISNVLQSMFSNPLKIGAYIMSWLAFCWVLAV